MTASAAAVPLRPMGPILTWDPPAAPIRPTFADPALQAAFWQDGYVVVDLIGAHECAELREVWRAFYGGSGASFATSGLNEPSDPSSLRLHHHLVQRFSARVRHLFVDHEILHGYALCKGSVPFDSDDGTVPLHQDWTYLDEQRFRGALVWCPLVDTDTINGALQVVPGSHRYSAMPRGTGNFDWPYDPVAHELQGQLVTVAASAGRAIVYDGALIHASRPNAARRERPVIGLGLGPVGAEHWHYHADDAGNIERFDVRPEYFSHEPLARRPEGRVISIRSVEPIDDRDTAAALGRVPSVPGAV